MNKRRVALTVFLQVLILALCLWCAPTKALAAKAKGKSADAKAAIEACVGKTAAEALHTANEAGFTSTFKDSFNVDVTKAVKGSPARSEIGQAIVTDVSTSDGFLLVGPSATFTLDYVDPDAQQAREERERREQAEQLIQQNRREIEQCTGELSGKVQRLADEAGFDLTIYDAYGTDITNSVRKAKKGSRIRNVKVTDVTVEKDYSKDTYTVVAYVNYVHPKSLERVAKENGWPTNMTISDWWVEVEDGDPTSYTPKYYITVTGYVTNNGKWAVRLYSLPALGGTDYSFQRCAEMELEGGAKELKPGETLSFRSFVSTTNPNSTVIFQTENSKAVIEGAQAISDEIGRQLRAVKETHDANIDYERDNMICYYTASGSCYHSRPGCPALSNSSYIYETTIGEAKSWGLEACDRCH